MTITIPFRRTAPKHRAADEVARLRAQLTVMAVTDLLLLQYVATADRARDKANAKAGRYDEAEARAGAAEQAMADLKDELLELRAFRDNHQAVTVPPMHRDIDPGDHPTEPTGIDVRDLRTRFATGPVVSLHHSPQATSPAHVPAWIADADTLALPALRLVHDRT